MPASTRLVALVVVLAAAVATPAVARGQFDLPPEQPAASAWRPRARLLPTLRTVHRGIESRSGFGLEFSAERPVVGERLAPWIGLVVAGDDRRARRCAPCANGRMSAYLLTTGVTVRPVPSWPVAPWIEASVGAGGVTWSDAVVSVPVGLGFVGGGRGGSSGTWRGALGAGVDVRWGARALTVGASRSIVHEQRWDGPRAVTTLVLGARARW